ncbi:MAG: DEAD/DEAH box helicase [Acidobacteriota bacterium]
MGFTKFNLHPDLLSGIHDMGYARPTPIQEKAIPPILEGRDVAGCAQTGTGKTAAYLLPLVHRLIPLSRGTTRCLILTPTRELTLQVDEQLAALAYHSPVRGAAVFGGVPMYPQEAALRAGVDIVTATPGRLLDHLRYDYLSLKSIEVLVLDEADRMLDMGFLPDLHRILSHIPDKRQNLLFSATLEGRVSKLARQILKDPAEVWVGRVAPASGITHAVYPVAQQQKTELLLSLLQRTQVPSGLVFTRTRQRANSLARALSARRLNIGLIHSGLDQQRRLDALSKFRRGRVQLLVATDVASRGLDIDGISHVINYDVPRSPDDYIHRSGRTARLDARGEALTFVAPDEHKDLRAIEQAIGHALPRVRLPDFDYRDSGPGRADRTSRPGAGSPGRRRRSRGGHATGRAGDQARDRSAGARQSHASTSSQQPAGRGRRRRRGRRRGGGGT